MHWNQIPESWQAALNRLAPGQVSEIIKGPKERFWLIKLVNKTVDPQITFATEKAKILETLQQQKATALSEGMLNQLKKSAKIVYPK
jgi:parvulin-like peptidyl-prolyl isomerase